MHLTAYIRTLVTDVVGAVIGMKTIQLVCYLFIYLFCEWSKEIVGAEKGLKELARFVSDVFTKDATVKKAALVMMRQEEEKKEDAEKGKRFQKKKIHFCSFF